MGVLNYNISIHLAQNFWISKDDHSVLGSRQSDIETAWIVQETNALMFVASDTAENNIIFLATLEGVNTGDLDFLIQVLLQGAVELHVVDNVGSLAFVRRNHADLRWNNT